MLADKRLTSHRILRSNPRNHEKINFRWNVNLNAWSKTESLRQLKRRLRDRMIAAHMAHRFLKEAETGEVPKLPARVKRLSINAMSELVLEDAGYSEPEDVETRRG